VTVPEGAPTLGEILDDLRVLRERGLVRIRHTELSALTAATGSVPAAVFAGGGPRAVEALLRAAVGNLGEGSLGAAAAASFGLGRGDRDSPASDRRRRAADAYRVSVERFRKYHERIVLEQVAEEIMKLCLEPATSVPGPDEPPVEVAPELTFEGTAGETRFPITVHVQPVELLCGVDAIVVPQNVYFEMPPHFKSSVSAAVGRTSARRGEDGKIVADQVRDELRAWMREHGRAGLPVAPGTVVASSPGEMASQGIRRLYHAAIASPRPGSNDYHVDPTMVAQAVRNVLTVGRTERQAFVPPLRSIGFPLLGAGRGGLTAVTSFTWLWSALEIELRANGAWDVHFLTRNRATAGVIVAGLSEAGVIPVPPQPA
jgi:O-acetyl-ADP-ribose deacetylase (regulator of RNase III)